MENSRFFALSITYSIAHSDISFFFLFSSHKTRKSSQGKSSYRLWNYDSEFWTIVWLIIFKRKHMICRFQKHALTKNSWSKLRSLFALSGQNDHFAPKSFKVVMWHIIRKRLSWIFRKNHFRCEKCTWDLLAAKIKNLKNFCDDVIIT